MTRNTISVSKRLQPAPSLLRHFAAVIYDSFLVIALIFVVNGIALAVTVKLSGGEQDVVNPLLGQCLTVLSILAFFSAFWLKNGQTLGMQAWRLKLESTDGGNPKLYQAVIRCVAATLSAGFFGLGYAWRLLDRNQRYWHDYASSTQLILLPKAESKNQGKPQTEQES